MSQQINRLLQQAYQSHQAGQHELAKKGYLQVLQSEPNNPDALVLLGALHYETDVYAESVAYFERLLALEPERIDFLNNLAAAYQMIGQNDKALPLYQRLVVDLPTASHYYNLGSALKDDGQPDAAIAAFEAALRLQPAYAKAHNNLGSVYKSQGQLEQAQLQFEAAIQADPHYLIAWTNLADITTQTGQLSASEHAYQQLIQWQPADANLRYKLGRLYQVMGHLEAALSHLQTAVELSPQYAEAWRSLGVTQQALGNFEGSIISLKQALVINPQDAQVLNNLGNSYRELGQMPAAIAVYEQAQSLEPTDANRLRLATLLPPVYQSLDDMHAWRQRFESGIDDLLATGPLQITDPLKAVGQTNFYLAYQGGNDRPLQEKIAQLYRPLLPLLPETQLETAPLPESAGRPRVGVVSAFLYNHSITHYYAQHLRELAGADLDLIVFLVPGGLQDAVTEDLQAIASQTISLPHDLAQARKLIARQSLDLLIYPDIGLEPFTYFLAFTRLAPVQVVLPGHPVTTGVPSLDYFISNTYTERPETARDSPNTDYSEQLVCLESLPVWYQKPQLPPQYLNREALGLPSDKHIYLCPMTLFKIHPEMDLALKQILDEDPEAEIYFFKFKQSLLHQQLAERFERSLGSASQRVHFLAWASSEAFFSYLHEADVLLDSFHFGGGSTHYLCFAVGTPLVTVAADYLRGRSGAGMYQFMGITETVAETPQAYATQAVQIAQDADLRARLKSQILAQSPRLFENLAGPQAFCEWVLTHLNDSQITKSLS